ncbi:MAG: Gfo/Idh/MocA family oxidoreductase [Elusimicrobia bacterium]|nr:Gfo/Idh/MocA family oxidoreductase [Elusimicrobiota bacterium]
MPVRVGVVGVGKVGQHHARILRKTPGVALVGLIDPASARAERLARKLQVPYGRDPQELLGRVDAVTIAVPTPHHFPVARTFLERGVHCLIEKPFTQEVEEADRLIELARRQNLVLQVGHVERFNPAVMACAQYIHEPKFIEASRLGPYDPRVNHVGVVLDLMIHDLDIVLFLVNSRVQALEAFGARILSGYEDIAKVRLRFANGCVADLSASRISLERFRKIRIFQSDSYISLDYTTPQVKVYRKRKSHIESFRDIERLTPRLSRQEPLALELEHFVQCVAKGQEPLVSGEHGRNALDLAREILAQMKVLA